MPAMMEFEDRKWRDREALKHIIGQWNANRLDLFSLSEPNEEFEFHGVMRFYFQDAGQKIATKCIRVSSTGSTQAVIETLIEKFRPDMKMLHMAEYALYEIHPNGEERCLGVDEKPLLVQLNWHKDDREGRFLLRRADEKSTLPAQQPPEESSFRRKLSKREKRNAKKENKLRKLKSSDNDGGGGGQDGENGGKNGTVAEKLYTELPETSFTRSISNPEAVMRRRRQQKLERKLQLFRSKDGGPDTGGTLKIYGESLCRDVPYKTLLLSVRETAAYVVREMLDKYALTREDPSNYCLVQVTGSPPNQQQQQQTGNNNSEPPSEYILEDDECPLSILMNHTPGSGPVMFHVRRRPADSNSQAARRRKKKLSGSGGSQSGGNANANSCGSGGGGGSIHRLTGGDLASPDQDPEQRTLPYLVELNPDGSEVRQGNQIRRHFVSPTVTEVGSERPAPPHPSSPIAVPSIQLFGPGIHPRHCVLAHTEGMVTLTPCSPQAETYVNGQRLCETTLLQHGCVIRFGRNAYQFRFIDPASEFRTPAASTALNYERFTGQPGGANRAVSTTPSASNLIPSASAAAAAIVAPPPPPAGPVVVPGTDPILPAVLELPEDVEDAFLHSLIPNLDTRQIVFRLAPTYSLYLMARYRASTHFRPELNPMERAQRLTLTLSRVGAMMQAIVQERYADPPSLAFWMANASELLHFLKSDRHICAFSLDGQDLLAEAVQIAFRNASVCLTAELLQSMPPMLSPPSSPQVAEGQPEQPEEEAATAQVLSVLSSTMGLLRRCRVNAALTIQLFSQLFHALNAALFNRLVGLDSPRLPASASHHLLPPPGANLCSRQWGLALSRRLRRLEAWAERQGLELAADCHLARVMQAAHLLQSPKNTAEQLVETASSCFKLNSLQLRALLERYRPSPQDGEPANAIPPQLIQHIVRVAEGTADELQLADGRPLRLDEDSQLAVPFLLPDDGYSCDVMRGIPTGLMEVLGPLQQAGLCRLTPQPTSSGLWTIYMGEGSTPVVAPQPQQHPIRAPSVAGEAQAYAPQQQQQQPELQLLQLRKASDSMGLSIVAARGTGQQQLGIYIKSVVKGGSADIDGRLQAGDQLLSVDGYSLVGITQDRAAEILMRTSHTVRLEVAKQAAMFHGLATLLSQPSPTSTVSRSTLSLNKMDPVQQQQQQQRRPPLPQTQQQQQHQQQQQAFQERLVDWDRPPTSHRMNSNSSPSLANINDPQQQQQQQAMGQGRPLQQMAPQLRNANSRSVPALHHNSEPNVGMNQSQDGIQHFQTEQQQQQFYAQQQQQQQQRAMMNQRAMSAQLLSQPRYPNPPQQSTEPTSPTRSTAQQQLQQQQATRSRSVQNLSAETQQQQQTRASATTLRARHPSDERQYQNIALYQQQQQQHMQFPGGQGPRPQYAQQLPLPPPPPQQQQQQQQQQPRGLLSPVSRTAPGVVVPASVAHLRHPSMAQQQQSSDSPPPPPPPPVSTHPLVAAAAATGQQQQQQSPWEREEKERETAMRRQEAARQWMEEQIEELESLGLGNRTPKQEEQLRALRLEMEFRKRAMEAAEEEDDDDGEASGDRRGMLRLVQEDLERARQWRLEKQQQVQQPMPPPQQQQPMTNGTNNNNTATVPDQERMRKIEAFQRKQRELEATQAAEERIIREAQRRKEEDIHRHQQMQQQHQQQQQQQQQHWRPTPGANIPIPPPSAMSGGQRLDGVIHQSSSMEMAQHVSSSTSTSSATTSTTTKRVSFFQETTQSSDNKTPTREDPDAFILEAENMLANTPPKTSGSGVMGGGGGGGGSSIDQLLLTGVSTPGVIGSQEVYRDPRLKRLAEQQQQQKTQLKPGPEKLTFQEKMKMFALESGEQATPKDKSKISKAQ